MKKLIIILLALSICSCRENESSKAQKTTTPFTINATISGIKDGAMAKLFFIPDNRNFEQVAIDSIKVSKGQFKLSGIKSHLPSEYEIVLFNNPLTNKQARVTLWIENNDITINGSIDDVNNLQIEGSHLNKIQHQSDKIVIEFAKNVKQTMDSELKVATNPNAFNKIIKKYTNLLDKKRFNFIFNNPDNMVALSNIFTFTDKTSKDSLQVFYEKLDNNLKNSKEGIALKNIISTKKPKVRDVVGNFKAFDLKENSIQFSDFKGKVILLDFWANWCYWCHIENRELFSKLYQKFKNKNFVIISYSLDTKKSSWEKSSEKDGIQWVNISNLKGMNDPVAIRFGASTLLTSFLIDQNGMIQKVFLGYDKEHNKTIEEEIKKLLR